MPPKEFRDLLERTAFWDVSPQIGHERGMVSGPGPTFWRGARQVIGRCGSMSSAIGCPSCGHIIFAIGVQSAVPRPRQRAPQPIEPRHTAALLLRVADAAELLQISRTKLYELIARGEVPAVRIGGSVRVSRRELERIAG
jgi:excisionase family DNA binding protein